MERLLHYKLTTHLNRDEVVRRLKNATVLKEEWVSFHDREKYLFRGEVDDQGFLLRINPLRIAPNFQRSSLLPMVRGTIIAGANGNCGIYFELKEEWQEVHLHWIFKIFFVFWGSMTALLILYSLINDPLNCIWWVLFGLAWRLIVFLKRKYYWQYVGRCLVKWLEELWDAREVM